MNEQIADHYYKRIIEDDDSELLLLEEYKKVNAFLKSNDWLFISPIFFQGYELQHFLRLSKSGKDEKQNILNIIQKKFYDLDYTASIIEGYCAHVSYIKPFLMSIEHSLILCFQKDYEGSIKTIIPIIEGILRKYLITEKGFKTETVRPKNLRESFERIKSDLIAKHECYLKSYKENGYKIEFSDFQFTDLIAKKKQYFDTWFSFVSDFVNQSFYLKTTGRSLTNEVNRHSILHEFGFDFEYNFENYVKIFFLLQFLTWAFLLKEGKAPINRIDTYRFLEKVYAYEQVIKNAESLLYEKHILFKNYDNYKEDILKQKFPVYQNKLLPKKLHFKQIFFKKIGKKMWNANIDSPINQKTK